MKYVQSAVGCGKNNLELYEKISQGLREELSATDDFFMLLPIKVV